MNSSVIVSAILSFGLCSAATVSDTGTLTSPEGTFLTTVDLTAAGGIILQTYGFGGDTNDAGEVIPAGGFDPFIGLFSGSGPTAVLLSGTADNLTNYTKSACGSASLVSIGGVFGQCGDVNLQFTGLAAGTYTVLLSDANYVPNAMYETTGYLGDGFSDLTGGLLPFQTCYDASHCRRRLNELGTRHRQVGSPTASASEPAPFALSGLGLALVIAGSCLRSNKKTQVTKKEILCLGYRKRSYLSERALWRSVSSHSLSPKQPMAWPPRSSS